MRVNTRTRKVHYYLQNDGGPANNVATDYVFPQGR